MKKRTKKQKLHAQQLRAQSSSIAVTQVGGQYSFKAAEAKQVAPVRAPIRITRPMIQQKPTKDLSGKELFAYDTNLIFGDLRKTLLLVTALFAILLMIYVKLS